MGMVGESNSNVGALWDCSNACDDTLSLEEVHLLEMCCASGWAAFICMYGKMMLHDAAGMTKLTVPSSEVFLSGCIIDGSHLRFFPRGEI